MTSNRSTPGCARTPPASPRGPTCHRHEYPGSRAAPGSATFIQTAAAALRLDFREPLAALVHAVAFACCLVALFALLRPMLAKSCAFGYALRVVLSFLTIRLLGTLFARYLLYQFALVYAFPSRDDAPGPDHGAAAVPE